jgi:hypothetical protein
MLTKLKFKETFEDDGIVNVSKVTQLFRDIEEWLEDNNNRDWLVERKEWLIEMSQCLQHYVNDVERNISERKENKQDFGLSDRDDWISWVKGASNFKNILNDLRLHSEEIKVLVIQKLKKVNKAIKSEEYLTKESRKNVPKRYVIQITFHNEKGYENIAIYSDVEKITDTESALSFIDLYQNQCNEYQSVVNYRAFITTKNFQLNNTRMVEASSIL